MVAAQVGVAVADPASVDAAIESRFSTRAILPTPVARSMLEEVQRANGPSGMRRHVRSMGRIPYVAISRKAIGN